MQVDKQRVDIKLDWDAKSDTSLWGVQIRSCRNCTTLSRRYEIAARTSVRCSRAGREGQNDEMGHTCS